MRKMVLSTAFASLIVITVLISSCSSGGFKWEEQSQDVSNAVHALNDSYVWAVSDSGNFSFYNGSSWAQRFRVFFVK